MTAALVVAGCGGGDDGPVATTTTAVTTTTVTPTTTTTGDSRRPALAQSCTHDERGVRIVVRYPQGWHVNDPRAAQPCSAFDPEPVNIRPATEFPADLAVIVRVEPVVFDRAVTPGGVRVEEESSSTIDGRRARRQTVVSTGEGLYPAGRRSLRYVIDGGPDRTIIATTSDVQGNDFAESSSVLDAMVTALEIEPRRS
ncbi:MAG: hypothetical protein M3203_13080 [Actinomycetota bacterium]|nr:hypothetical protein [Actinomycetota bacterium]